jgi:hypothetical protein
VHAQQQLSLSDSEAQDFIEVTASHASRKLLLTLCQHATYSIDNDNNVIVGLPPPREGWVTARSYGLEESLAERALQVRPTLFGYAKLADRFAVLERAYE